MTLLYYLAWTVVNTSLAGVGMYAIWSALRGDVREAA